MRIKAAIPMLVNAAVCLAIHHYLNIKHNFALGTCFGGSLVMALMDASRAEE